MAKQKTTSTCLKDMADVMNCDFHFSDDEIDQDIQARLDHLRREEANLLQSDSPTATLQRDIDTFQQSCETLATLHAKAVAAGTQQ
jgi:hypothetical protein